MGMEFILDDLLAYRQPNKARGKQKRTTRPIVAGDNKWPLGLTWAVRIFKLIWLDANKQHSSMPNLQESEHPRVPSQVDRAETA